MINITRKIFKVIFGIFILFGLCIVALLVFVNLDSTKEMIASKSKKILNRPIVISGSIRPSINFINPSIVFNDVTFVAVKEDDVEISAKKITFAIKNIKEALGSDNWIEKTKLNIELVGLKIGDNNINYTKASVTGKGSDLHIEPLSFHVFGSKFIGKLDYIDHYTIKLSGKLSDFDYGQFSDGLEGSFDANIDLNSKGYSLDKILNNLNGKALISAGKGKLGGRVVDLWASDFLTSILPFPGKKKHTDLTCAVGLFDIVNGQAESKILIDTDNVLIEGKGNINLVQGELDLKFKPEPKQVSLVNMAVPLNVKGNWANPSIIPAAGGLVKKLGTIALNAVNPATMALPLLKLEKDQDNPCIKMLTKKTW